jgi:hypothetical protein
MTTTKAILWETFLVIEVVLCWITALLLALPLFASVTLWEKAAAFRRVAPNSY